MNHSGTTAAAARPRDRTLTVNGLQLHYLEWGTAGNPPLVMIHGLTGNAHNFDRVAPRFADRYHVLALDVRGRGESERSPDRVYQLEYYRDDLRAFVELLDLSPLSLLGISMGGLISIAYAGVYPDSVARIALDDIGPDIDPRGLQRIFTYLVNAPSAFDDLPSAARWLQASAGYFDALNEAEMIEYTRWGLEAGPNGKWVWKLDSAIRDVPFQLKHPSRIVLWDELAKITCPALIIRGETSDILSRETTEKMLATLPEAEAVEVPGIGHAPLLTEAAAVAALDRFFGRAPRTGPTPA